MVFTSSRRKQGREVSFRSKERRYISGKSHFNSSENNNSNASNSDDVIGNSNLTFINVHTKSSLNKIVTLKKETYTQSSISINDEITYDNNTSG